MVPISTCKKKSMNDKKRFSGRFWFKRTVNGNLIGEFSNNVSESISTESADLITTPESFVGVYILTPIRFSTKLRVVL